jgi:hypothetical protein
MPGIDRIRRYANTMTQILNIKRFNDGSLDACAYSRCYGCIRNSTAIVVPRLKHAVYLHVPKLDCFASMFTAFVSCARYEDNIR